MLGALRRLGRSRVDVIRGAGRLGSGAVPGGGALARARELPAWGGRLAVTGATRLIDDGDYTAAIRTLLGAVAATPRDARVHYYLGLAYARLGVPRGALNQLSDAVRLAPGDARVHDALGQALRAVGDPRAARREFEEAARLGQAVHLKPRSAEIRLLRAAALRRAGDVNGMAREYTEVRRLAPAGPLGEFARQALNERNVP